ncbi:class I adenylate-forming enzyme family protein [Rhodococcus sp. NPDC003318]|uniref:class I adenylate-forming enzyme family protein n=1 Tax=Rhodococcus sp. NPDC003318 TaxID=3364503 RepID=UPI003681E811
MNSIGSWNPRVGEERVAAWRRAGFRTEQTIGSLLEDSATRWPTRIAAVTEREQVTFGELAARSRQVAAALVAGGVRSGDLVCWMLPTGPDAIAVAAAIWRIGAVSSPLVPIYGLREIKAALEQVRPAAIVTTGNSSRRSHPDEFLEACREVGVRPPVLLLTDGRHPGWRAISDERGGGIPSGAIPSAANDPALVLFTSGTESEPKGVVHSVAGLAHELRTTVTGWGLSFRDRMVMASPMTHITGLLQGFMIPAQVGAAAILMERWDADRCVELIEEHGATYMAGATPFLRELAQAYASTGRDRSRLVQYCCGGASVPPALIRSVEDLGIKAYRAWGMTELPTATLPNELDSVEDRSETDGRLAPGVELKVVDEAGEPVPAGEVGELFLRGPEMMLGYVRRNLDGTAFTADGWMRTGDRGWVDDRGQVTVTGRSKDIINRGGEKFSVREIEDAVARHPDVSQVAVVAVPGGRLGERVGAAVVSGRTDLSIDEIGTAVAEAGLAWQKRPEIVAVFESLPTNATGKIDRKALAELLAGKTSDGRKGAAG